MHTDDEEELKEYIIFVGNPGTGKSTQLNMMCRAPIFKSGISIGEGLTREFQTREVNGVIYGDTPGLDDIKSRESAATQIGKALKRNGRYKLFFVVTLESGRVRSSDAATIRLVLQAVTVNVPFAVIINKLSTKLYNEMHEEELNVVLAGLLGTTKRAPSGTHLIKFDPSLNDESDVVPPYNQSFVDFIQQVPYILVKPENVEKIKHDEYVDLINELETQVDAMREDKKALEAVLEQMKQQALKEAEESKARLIAMEQETSNKLSELEKKQQLEITQMQKASEDRMAEMKSAAEKRDAEMQRGNEEMKREAVQRYQQLEKASNERFALAEARHNEVINGLNQRIAQSQQQSGRRKGFRVFGVRLW